MRHDFSDDEEDNECPLCVQELDLSDRNFLPWCVPTGPTRRPPHFFTFLRGSVAHPFLCPSPPPRCTARGVLAVRAGIGCACGVGTFHAPVLPSCVPCTHPQLTLQPSVLLPTSLCRHHIRENLNGLCPACRTPYNADPHAFSAVDRQECVSSLFPPRHEAVTHLNSPTRYNPHIGVSTES